MPQLFIDDEQEEQAVSFIDDEAEGGVVQPAVAPTPTNNLDFLDRLAQAPINPLANPLVPIDPGAEPLAEVALALGTGAAEFTLGSIAGLGQQIAQKVIIPPLRKATGAALIASGAIGDTPRDKADIIIGRELLAKKKRSPGEQRRISEESRAFFQPLVFEPKTKVAQQILEPIMTGFEIFGMGFREADKFYSDLGFPNLGFTLGVAGELAAFKGLHISGKLAKGWIRRTNAKIRKAKQAKKEAEIEDIINKAKEEVAENPKLQEELAEADQRFAETMRQTPEEGGLIFRDQAEEIRSINAEQKSAVAKQRDIQRVLNETSERVRPVEPEVGETLLVRETPMEALAREGEQQASALEAEGKVAEAEALRLQTDEVIMQELGIQAAAETVKAREWNPDTDPVTVAAFRSKEGVVIVGETHADAFGQVIERGLAREFKDAKDFQEGFETESGRFITVDEARRATGFAEINAIKDRQLRRTKLEEVKKPEVIETTSRPKGRESAESSPRASLKGEDVLVDSSGEVKVPPETIKQSEISIKDFTDPFTDEPISKLRIASYPEGFQQFHVFSPINFSVGKKARLIDDRIVRAGQIVQDARPIKKVALDPYWIEGRNSRGEWVEIERHSDLKSAEDGISRFRQSRLSVIKSAPSNKPKGRKPIESRAQERETPPPTREELGDQLIALEKPTKPEDLPAFRDQVNEVLKDLDPLNTADAEIISLGENMIEALNVDLGLKERPSFVEAVRPQSLPPTPIPKSNRSRQMLEDLFEEVKQEHDPLAGELAAEAFREETRNREFEGGKEFEEIRPERPLDEGGKGDAADQFLADFDIIGNESGAVTLEPLRRLTERFGKNPKAGTFLNQLRKAGLREDDINMSGIPAWIAQKGFKPQERFSLRHWAEEGEKGGFDLKKRVLGDVSRPGLPNTVRRVLEDFDAKIGVLRGLRQTHGSLTPTDSTRLVELEGLRADLLRGRGEIVEPSRPTQYSPESHSTLNLPGEVSNYRENLYKYKPKGGKGAFNEPHWGPEGDNVMAHSRIHDRKLTTGEEVAFIDEAQSVWHERGRQEGYQKTSTDTGVPNAPFKRDWWKIIFRDAVNEAVASGKDGIAWTTAKTQIDRNGPKAAELFDRLYEKGFKKFAEKEYGVKPEVKGTPTQRSFEDPLSQTSTQVHYLPFTEEMKAPAKSILGEGLLADLGEIIRNERGAIDLSVLRDVIESAKERKISTEDYLKGIGLSKEELRIVERQLKRVNRLDELSTQAMMPETYETGLIVNQKDRISIHKDRHNVQTTLVKLPVYERQMEVFTRNKDLSREQVVGGSPGSIKDIPAQFRTPIRVMERFSPELVDMIALPYEGRFKASNVRIDAETTRIRTAKKGLSLKEKDQLGIHMIGRDPKGVEINKANNATPVLLEDLSPRQIQGMEWLNNEYFKLHTELNEARAGIGMEPIPFRKNYAVFVQVQNIAHLRDTGYNLVMANGNSISNTYRGFDAVPFNHVKSRSKAGLGKIINDPFAAYERYMRQSMEHIYISPILSLVDQMRSSMVLPKTGKRWTLASHRPNLDKYLGDWSMRVARIDTHPLGPGISKGMSVLGRNLTYATLSNVRSSLIQPTALVNVYADVGLTNTVYGIASLVKPGTHKFVFDNSRHIQKNVYDAQISALQDSVRNGSISGVHAAAGQGSLALLKYTDYETRIAAWKAAYRYAKNSKKAKLTDQQAKNYADTEVIKTQASASPGMIAPIQGTALGKGATLWQTFVINNMGFLMSDVAGFKNPRVGNKRAFAKGMRYFAAATMVGTFFEDVLNIQSPIPNIAGTVVKSVKAGDEPQEMAIKLLREFIEPIPVIGSLRWGGTMLGAIVDFVGDMSKVLSPGIADPKVFTKEHAIQTAELAGKGLGIPLTGQIAGSRKATKRGEDWLGIVLRSYAEGVEASGRRSRSRSRRSSRSSGR